MNYGFPKIASQFSAVIHYSLIHNSAFCLAKRHSLSINKPC